jgi:hypothetical protein
VTIAEGACGLSGHAEPLRKPRVGMGMPT